MSWMAGSLAPVMYWVVRTTLCSALRSDAQQLTYQAVMQRGRMLSLVQIPMLFIKLQAVLGSDDMKIELFDHAHQWWVWHLSTIC